MPETQTQDKQYTYDEFADIIRKKYPQSEVYKKKPSKELVDAWIQAKPERSVYVKKIKGFDPFNMGTSKVPSQIPVSRANVGSGVKTTLEDTSKIRKESAAAEQVGASLPSIGGMAGGLVGGGKGPISSIAAGAGGALGSVGQDIMKRIVLGQPDPSFARMSLNALKEGGEEAGLNLLADKGGEAFFKLLGKLPHATNVNGIKFLPSDLGKGGMFSQYMENLLTNLIPSSKIMSAFKEKQNAAVIGAASKLVKGFSRFNGTSEEFGIVIQNAMRSWDEQIQKQIAQAGGTSKAFQKAFGTSQLVQEYNKIFKNELSKEIISSNKPELILGYIRKNAGLEDTRTVLNALAEKYPTVRNAVKTRLMQDIVNETLTGSKDPILKQLQKQDTKFVGSKFQDILNKVGEDKLKAILGEQSYKNVEDFSNLFKHIGQTSNGGAGKFWNIIFLLGPIRTGFGVGAIKKLALEGYGINRLARYMTSTEGIRLTENYARAMSVGVKLPKLLIDEMTAFNERSDREYEAEQQKVEDEYYKNHPDEVKYRKQKGDVK